MSALISCSSSARPATPLSTTIHQLAIYNVLWSSTRRESAHVCALSENICAKLTISQADDDDLDALSFTQPQASSSAPPAGSSIQPPSSGSGISGRIDQSNAPKSTTFGGVRMETRYTGEPTLDEPVSKTIVLYSLSAGLMGR
jgi:hypothetical protein